MFKEDKLNCHFFPHCVNAKKDMQQCFPDRTQQPAAVTVEALKYSIIISVSRSIIINRLYNYKETYREIKKTLIQDECDSLLTQIEKQDED